MQSPIFFENNLVMSDDEGSIKKINKQGKIYWKVRIYEKIYKKLYKNLTFALHNNHVYVADNIGFVYVINYKNGEIIWKKNFGIPFSFGPVRDRFIARKMNIGNNWYSDNI